MSVVLERKSRSPSTGSMYLKIVVEEGKERGFTMLSDDGERDFLTT